MSAVAPISDYYVASFDEAKDRLPGTELPWLMRLRMQAVEQFSQMGFPSRRDEDWKYTNVRSIEKHAFQLASEFCVGLVEDDIGPALMGDLNAHRLAFVNGRYTPQLSKPGQLADSIRVGSLARALVDRPEIVKSHLAQYADSNVNGFSALNLAYLSDGALIELPKGIVLDRPIHLLYLSTAQSAPAAYHLRNLIVAHEGSQATIIEHFISLGDSVYLNNIVTEVALEENAAVKHYKLQQESTRGFHVATLQAQQARDSRFTSYSVAAGGALTRNDINSVLGGEGAECNLYGLYIGTGRQHIDYHTRVDHKFPHGTSREFYKGVLGGRARAVFNGRVYVHPGAQQTDATQSNKNLLLSPDAEVDTKPQLEIYADDVTCSHGATVGQLDEQMLFYLRTRGIDEITARGMLTYGFAHDLVEQMDLAPIRTRIEEILVAKLPHTESLKDLA